MSKPYTKSGVFACAPETQRGQPTILDSKGDRLLYCNNNNVIIRSISQPQLCEVITQHSSKVSVAKFSPLEDDSFVASCDAGGLVKVWDATPNIDEGASKRNIRFEGVPFVGKVMDLNWDSKAQNLMVVGGNDNTNSPLGHIFQISSGSSAGEIMGHSGIISACSFSPNFNESKLAVTASHDFKVNVYNCSPKYQFHKALAFHTNVVHSVKFSTTGKNFVSVGGDRKIILYDGLSGDFVAEFKNDGHSGSIFAVSWSPDSTQLLTSSGDSCVKLWDASTQNCIQTIPLYNDKPNVDTQQVGNIWSSDNTVISLGLSGKLNYLDVRSKSPLVRTVLGHQKGICSLASNKEQLLTGSYDGRIMGWDFSSEEEKSNPKIEEIQGHTNKINGLVLVKPQVGFSVAMDDTLKSVDLKEGLTSRIDPLVLGGEPVGVVQLDADDKVYLAVATKNQYLHVFSESSDSSLSLVTKVALPATPTSLAAKPNEKIIAVSFEGNLPITLFHFSANNIEKGDVLKDEEGNKLGVGCTTLAYSPDGKYIAFNNSAKILLYSATESGQQKLVTARFSFHSARVTKLLFHHSSQLLLSCGIDNSIYLWSIKNLGKKVGILNAHPPGPVFDVAFLPTNDSNGNFKVASVGSDACLKVWEISDFQ